MPDLPELYEALDRELDSLQEKNSMDFQAKQAAIISALCAAIEVKQLQELNECLNSGAMCGHEDDEEADLPTLADLKGIIPT